MYIDDLTNKLLGKTTTTVAASDESDGEDEGDAESNERDDNALEQKNKTSKRKRGFQHSHFRLLTTNPICNQRRCKNKILDRIKSTGAYKKNCSTCLEKTMAWKSRKKIKVKVMTTDKYTHKLCK
jgi:hypothetical protein